MKHESVIQIAWLLAFALVLAGGMIYLRLRPRDHGRTQQTHEPTPPPAAQRPSRAEDEHHIPTVVDITAGVFFGMWLFALTSGAVAVVVVSLLMRKSPS